METLEKFTIKLAPRNRQRLAYVLMEIIDSINKKNSSAEVEKEVIRLLTQMLVKINDLSIIYSSQEIALFMSIAHYILESEKVSQYFKQEISFVAGLLNDNSKNEDGLTFSAYVEMFSEKE